MYATLREFEEKLGDAVIDDLRNALTNSTLATSIRSKLRFGGFFFRGYFVRNGRHDSTIRFDNDGFVADRHAALEQYFKFFGLQNSLNQLVSERERDRSTRWVELLFGADDASADAIAVPSAVLSALLSTEVKSVFDAIRAEMTGGHAAPTDVAARREVLDCSVELALSLALRSDKASALRTYIGDETQRPVEGYIHQLRRWLKGCQAFGFFIPDWGSCWCTFPVNRGTCPSIKFVKFFPACGLTLVTKSRLDDAEFKFIRTFLDEKLKAYEDQVLDVMDDFYASYTRITGTCLKELGIADIVPTRRSDPALRSATVQQIASRLPDEPPPYFSYLAVVGVMQLCELLAPASVENKPLTCTLVLGTPYDLLSYGAESGERIDSLGELSAADFDVAEGDGIEAWAPSAAKSIIGNAYFLEPEGVFLLLSPSDGAGIRPQALLRVKANAATFPASITGMRKGVIVFRVEHGSATAYVAGAPVARFERGREQWQVGDAKRRRHERRRGNRILIEDDYQFIFNTLFHFGKSVLHKRFRLSEQDCKVIATAVLAVRQLRYGCLLYFTTQALMAELSTTLRPSKPWSFVEGKRLDEFDADALARLFAMDGETLIDIDSGLVSGRHFLIPERSRIADMFTDEGSVSESFRGEWEKRLESPQIIVKVDSRVRTTDIEPLDVVLRKGTRHRKAMLMSRAFDEDGGLVLTVSSDGPITTWHHGIPITRRAGRA